MTINVFQEISGGQILMAFDRGDLGIFLGSE